MLGTNTISFAFIFYAIVWHGQILGNYRWLLLNFFVNSYLVDVLLAMVHLNLFLPASIYYLEGIVGSHLGVKLGLSIFLTTIAIKLLGFLIIIMYRHASIFVGKLQEFILEPRNLFFIICVVQYIVGFTPFIVMILDMEVRFLDPGRGAPKYRRRSTLSIRPRVKPPNPHDMVLVLKYSAS
jgi:hypothetical protein